MPSVVKDRPIELKRKMSTDTQKAIMEKMEITQDELDNLLMYKALIPSEDSGIMETLQQSVLDVLAKAEPVLIDTGVIDKSQVKALRSKVLDSVCGVFLNASVYSDLHLESLVKAGKLKIPAKTAGSGETTEDATPIKW